MLKSFLVPVDGSEYSGTAVAYALALGKKSAARMTLLYVVDITYLEGPFLADLSGIIGVTPFLDLQNHVREGLVEKSSFVFERHAAACREAGLECVTRVETGVVSRTICREALTSDIVVIGRRGEHASWRGFLLGSVVEEVVRGCVKPVLVTPREVRPVTRILAAYDGSRHASRALGLAASLAADLALPVVIVTVAGSRDEGREIVAEATSYLSTHELEVSTVIESGAAAEGILAAVESSACDLVVMGAYGRSRVREYLLGSTTAEIIRRSPVPVLLNR